MELSRIGKEPHGRKFRMKKLVITLLAAALSLPIAFAQAPTTTDTNKPAKKEKSKKSHKSKKETKTTTETTAPATK